jgi:hypothetical protein
MLDYDGRSRRSASCGRRRRLWRARSSCGMRSLAISDDRSDHPRGRPLEELERLGRALPVEFFGELGAERRLPDARCSAARCRPRATAALGISERVASRRGWSDLIERKRFSVVLHTRACRAGDERIERSALERWTPAEADGGGWRSAASTSGSELRARGRGQGHRGDDARRGKVAAGAFPGVRGRRHHRRRDAFEVVRRSATDIASAAPSGRHGAIAKPAEPESVTAFLETGSRPRPRSSDAA